MILSEVMQEFLETWKRWNDKRIKLGDKTIFREGLSNLTSDRRIAVQPEQSSIEFDLQLFVACHFISFCRTITWEGTLQISCTVARTLTSRKIQSLSSPKITQFPWFIIISVSKQGGSVAEWLERRIWNPWGRGFKSCSDRQLMLFSKAPSSTSWLLL